MKFEIGSIFPQANRKNAYIVKVKLVHGNEFAYSNSGHEIVVPASEIAYPEQVVRLLFAMQDTPSHFALASYERMPLFRVWFGENYLECEGASGNSLHGKRRVSALGPGVKFSALSREEWDKIKAMSFVWERNRLYKEFNALLESFDVFFCDEDSLLHSVSVVY